MAKKLPGLKRHTIGASKAGPPAEAPEGAVSEPPPAPPGAGVVSVTPAAPVEEAAPLEEMGSSEPMASAEDVAPLEERISEDTAAPSMASPPEPLPAPPPAHDLPSTTRRAGAEDIVERHGRYAIVGGALPLPLVDMAAIAAIQVRMLRALAGHYDVALSKHRAEAIVMPLMGSVAPHALGGAARWLVGPGLPVVGWLAAMAGGGASAHAITRVMGGLFVDHFERAGRAPVAGELEQVLQRGG